MTDNTRKDILTQAAEGRKADVLMHQINIDNYTLAIAEIEANHTDCEGMTAFAANLRDLLASSLLEQRKEAVLLKVINDQLEAM